MRAHTHSFIDHVMRVASTLISSLVLQEHGEKPGYTCPYCSEGFLKRCMLEEHMIEHAATVPKELLESKVKGKRKC